jgi:hypothetical protein
MFRKRFRGLLALVVLALPASARAQIYFTDGGVHTIDGPSLPVIVENDGTTLNVVSPALISSPPGNGIYALQGTTVNLMGGEVDGGPLSYAIAACGAFSATGGFVQGGNLGFALGLSGLGQISGGTFQGADGTGPYLGGSPVLSVEGGANLTISGGTFRGGNATDPNSYGGHALVSNGAINLAISGGTFLGGTSGANVGGGGQAIQLYLFHGHSSVTVTGGVFSAGAGGAPGGAYSLLDWNFSGGSSTVNIAGGLFSGAISLWLSGYSTLNLFGENLNYDSQTGMLTGMLEDGNQLNVPVEFVRPAPVSYSRHSGIEELTFGAVPEPPSIAILAIGIVGAGAAAASARLRNIRAARVRDGGRAI